MSQERKSLATLLVIVSLWSIFAPLIDAAYSPSLSKNQWTRILEFNPRSRISTHCSTAASRPDVNQVIFEQCILVNENDPSLSVAKILNVEDGSITEAEASVFGSPDALERGKGQFNASNESAFVKNLQEQIIMPYLTANQASTLA